MLRPHLLAAFLAALIALPPLPRLAAQAQAQFQARPATSEPVTRDALREVVRVDEETLGPQAPQTLAAIAELAATLPPEQAQPLWLRAAASPDPAVASKALSAIGALHESKGDRAGAAGFFRRALAKEELATGPTGIRVAVRLNSLALAVTAREGVPLLQRALAINQRVYGVKHPETAATEANLCSLLLSTGNIPEAVRMGSLAVATFDSTLGDHPRTAAAIGNLADALRAHGDQLKAEQMYRRALRIDLKAWGPHHDETKTDARNLAEFLRHNKRIPEALQIEAEYAIRPPY